MTLLASGWLAADLTTLTYSLFTAFLTLCIVLHSTKRMRFRTAWQHFKYQRSVELQAKIFNSWPNAPQHLQVLGSLITSNLPLAIVLV